MIVEGPSNEVALGGLLYQIFDPAHTVVKVCHGDMTSRTGMSPAYIVYKTAEIIKNYTAQNYFKQSDFLRVIQITDTDGVFIDDSDVIYDENYDHPFYTLKNIRSIDPSAIIQRNHKKASNLLRLSERRKIWNIPYSIYFMSCNLDHALYDVLNTSDNEKEDHAYAFARRYRNDIDGFKYLINGIAIGDDYRDSWKKIKIGRESLNRHRNLGLCFEDKN